MIEKVGGFMKLTNNLGDKPLWSQLYDILENRIKTGYYPTGTILPPELKLMEEFEVSRITVRQAMDKLIQSGYIVRKRGKGTLVLKKDDKIKTAFQSSFHGIYEKNNETNRKVIRFSKVIPPQEVIEYFNIDSTKKVECLVREIFIEEKPVAYFETYLNPEILFLDDEDMSGSLYQKLQLLNYEVDHVIENITAALASPKEKEIFALKENEAIVHRIRKGYHQKIPVEYTFSSYISSGYELTIHLQ